MGRNEPGAPICDILLRETRKEITALLAEEITSAQRQVRTDAYQMSIGEIVNMYDNREIIIDPEFQRLFRWDIGQKSRLIESLLLGIPVPSIFVFERENGSWELIDGLQRISTVLEFMGKLRSPDGGLAPPSILEGTRYLPSLRNTVWEQSQLISNTPVADQLEIDKGFQLSIRRARIGVEILKRPSDDQTKYDLFQRLNAGGTQANAQELRNCIILMVNGKYYRAVKSAAEQMAFQTVTAVTDEQIERQRHMEYAVRFLVHTFVPYDGMLDVEEYIDEGIVTLAGKSNGRSAKEVIKQTFELLNKVEGKNVLRRFEDGRHVGKVGLVGLEGIAVGVAKNLQAILTLAQPERFLKPKIQNFWYQPETASFTSPGLRGTTRIQRTVPFGADWFRP
ncbi:MAG TPA: DUF262 domain-containing protein [Bryobacteraceae bacterium]|jgi:hypothetical protein|nr:DUF262 domain-containing protein [Bryobacteraceae bacterium]